MSDAQRLLEIIDEAVVKHGGDLGGWTRLGDGELQLFDGRVTVRAELRDHQPPRNGMVHAHVYATVHEYDDELLDACVCGVAEDGDRAIAQAAAIWTTSVAGPIRSFIDGKPVCMTCQAGTAGGDVSQGFATGDYGLPGLRAYVGPSIGRWIDEPIQSAIDDSRPWFRYASEAAAPRRTHLAKATITSSGKKGWRRELEIDGHDVSHHDQEWPAGVEGPELGYITRFAVFEFSPAEIHRRSELDRTLCYFAEHFSKHDSVDRLMEAMIEQGFDADIVHEAESIATIAFGRVLFENVGARYSPTIIRARRDGRVETDVPLMSIPAYARARALAAQLHETMSSDDFQRLCLYNAESHALLQALEASEGKLDLSQVTMFPSVVPERGCSNETMEAALAVMNSLVQQKRFARKKPWWKFW